MSAQFDTHGRRLGAARGRAHVREHSDLVKHDSGILDEAAVWTLLVRPQTNHLNAESFKSFAVCRVLQGGPLEVDDDAIDEGELTLSDR